MKFSAISCTCPSCGAPQRFSPAEGTLICEFCDTKVTIEVTQEPIEEYNFHGALSRLKKEKPHEITKKAKCSKCGGSFTLTPYTFSTKCPYCGTPAVIDFIKEITPRSLIPFHISHKEAQTRFADWISSRWFAPSSFTKHAQSQEGLQGYYLPYWTYDSDTNTNYAGSRGDAYHVRVSRRVMVKDRMRQVTQNERRIRWTPVSGRVNLTFDDVTVGASSTTSRTILNALEPWDTTLLVGFDEKYLMGFESEEYAVGLDSGFEYAKMKMASQIKDRIKKSIGGDKQRIASVQTDYRDVTYKNILLPLWISSFNHKEKTYHCAINAQNGKVVGERPYSITKIALLVAAGISLLGVWCWLEPQTCMEIIKGTIAVEMSK